MSIDQPPAQTNDEYAHLLDPNADLSHLTIEGAAVHREVPTVEPAGVDERAAEAASIERAAVREPLTAAQIAAKRGGEMPTPDQVNGINQARSLGKHLH